MARRIERKSLSLKEPPEENYLERLLLQVGLQGAGGKLRGFGGLLGVCGYLSAQVASKQTVLWCLKLRLGSNLAIINNIRQYTDPFFGHNCYGVDLAQLVQSLSVHNARSVLMHHLVDTHKNSNPKAVDGERLGKKSRSEFLGRHSSLLKYFVDLPWPNGAVIILLYYPNALVVSGYLAFSQSQLSEPLSKTHLNGWFLFSEMLGVGFLMSFIIRLKKEKPI